MLNTVADHQRSGYDEKWCDGMLKFWLSDGCNRVATDDEREMVERSLRDDVQIMIREFIMRHHKSNPHSRLGLDCVECGFFKTSVTPNQRVSNG